MCEGCEECLTPTACRHFLQIRDASQARNNLSLVINFLTWQAEEKLGLGRAVFSHHCNHLNVIPYYSSQWWRRERLQSANAHSPRRSS